MIFVFNIEKVGRLLRAVAKGEVSSHVLMMRANISFFSLKKTLKCMSDDGLIFGKGFEVFLTEKGRKVLDLYLDFERIYLMGKGRRE